MNDFLQSLRVAAGLLLARALSPGKPKAPQAPIKQIAKTNRDLQPGRVPATPYDLAKTYLGTRELPGNQHNKTILGWLRRLMPSADADEISWCSSFVDAMAAETGYEQARKLTARSWLAVGEAIPAAMAQAGDVIVFWRESPDSWKGHVAFFQSWEGQKVRVLGGNQSNAVTSALYPRNQILGVRRLRRLAHADA